MLPVLRSPQHQPPSRMASPEDSCTQSGAFIQGSSHPLTDQSPTCSWLVWTIRKGLPSCTAPCGSAAAQPVLLPSPPPSPAPHQMLSPGAHGNSRPPARYCLLESASQDTQPLSDICDQEQAEKAVAKMGFWYLIPLPPCWQRDS